MSPLKENKEYPAILASKSKADTTGLLGAIHQSTLRLSTTLERDKGLGGLPSKISRPEGKGPGPSQ
jgi:hypothetical protein